MTSVIGGVLESEQVSLLRAFPCDINELIMHQIYNVDDVTKYCCCPHRHWFTSRVKLWIVVFEGRQKHMKNKLFPTLITNCFLVASVSETCCILSSLLNRGRSILLTEPLNFFSRTDPREDKYKIDCYAWDGNNADSCKFKQYYFAKLNKKRMANSDVVSKNSWLATNRSWYNKQCHSPILAGAHNNIDKVFFCLVGFETEYL